MSWGADYTEADRILLPADSLDAAFTLVLRAPADKAAVDSLRVEDAAGSPLSPQPAFGPLTVVNNKTDVHLTGIYYWGEGRIRLHVQSSPPAEYAYKFRRGPAISPANVPVQQDTAGRIWLYNFESRPLDLRWRIVSGNESICGYNNGQARYRCDSVTDWSQARIGPVASEAIVFPVPESWFAALHNSSREALIEFHFGGPNGPLLRQPLSFLLRGHLLALSSPKWVALSWPVAKNILWVLFGVNTGAILLMMAQVMIPNFRRCLRMENQLEDLQERLRAVSSDVGSRLYTRCQQELDSVRQGLALPSGRTTSTIFARMALSGNTAEVNRIEGLLPKIDTRISLTERLDERQTAFSESGSRDLPPSFYWYRAKLLGNVRGILSRQFITEADEKSAAASLDQLAADAGTTIDQFKDDLRKRISGLVRLFGANWQQGPYSSTIEGLPGCAAILNAIPAEPAGGWTDEEIIQLDLAAVRLLAISQMMRIECAMSADPDLQRDIRRKLCSDDPTVLEEALSEIVMASQGVWKKSVEEALKGELWDIYWEPTPVTDQDVLRVSFRFRNKDIDQSAAKTAFRCEWTLVRTRPAGNHWQSIKQWVKNLRSDDPGDTNPAGTPAKEPAKEAPAKEDLLDTLDADDNADYEAGWQLQFIPSRGPMKFFPRIYNALGEKTIMRPKEAEKGLADIVVLQPAGKQLRQRLFRGFIEAMITAIVPVIAVAIDQVNNGGQTTFKTLVLLGFTSQAIRAAVLPESVTGNNAAPAPAKPQAPQTQQKPQQADAAPR